MYIKQVRKTNKKSNKTYTYLHLVENIRTHLGPRQRLVLNLGNLNVKKDKYKELANCIESLLTGQEQLFSADPDISNHAQSAVRKIQRKNSVPSTAAESTEKVSDIRSIDISSISASEVRTIGPEYVCHKMWEELQIDKCLIDSGISANVTPLLQALVIGRAACPGSERYTKHWADTISAIYELTGNPLRDSLNSYYRGGDLMYNCKDALEAHLCQKERDLFSLTEKICFFDLTNTYFEGEMKKNPKAKFGRSKQKRKDCRLLTLALIIDEDGFIKHSKLYPGNQYEAHTLETMLTELGQINPLYSNTEKPTIVMDAGIADKKNIIYLQEKGFHYIVVNRSKTPFTESDVDDMEPLRVSHDGQIEISAKRHQDTQNNEVFILCKSVRKEMKERGIHSRQEQLFLEQLENTRLGITKKGCTKKYAKIVEKIGRLKEKYPKAAKLYHVDVISEKPTSEDINSVNATDILYKEKLQVNQDAQHMDGCYVLRSDRTDLGNNEIWSIYVMLTNIEQAFKDMKSSLGLRPNYHQKEHRGDAHMFISVLAYHITHMIEYKLKNNGDYRSWATIREILSSHCRLTIECNEYDNQKCKGKVFVRVCSKAENVHRDIYEKLQISSIPLERKYYENL